MYSVALISDLQQSTIGQKNLLESKFNTAHSKRIDWKHSSKDTLFFVFVVVVVGWLSKFAEERTLGTLK